MLEQFLPAPWLLPPCTKALNYSGVHDLDALLALRATAFGNWPKTVTLLTFTKEFSAMTQNTSTWGSVGVC